MGKKRVVLVDFNNLMYRSVFAHSTLSYKRQFTGGIFGAIDMISSAVNRYNIDRIMVCHDTKPYHREKVYKNYKSNRKKDFDEEVQMKISTTRKQMRDFFENFRFSHAECQGYEADDFIGQFARRGPSRYHQIFILSNDSDFYQLLTPRVFLITRNGLFGKRDFLNEYPGLKPKHWPRCLALMGSHNGVPGIKGVGPKTAYKAVISGMTDKEVFKKWRVRRSDIDKRTKLSTLPFPMVSDPPMPSLIRIKYNAAKFERFLAQYGIQFRTEYHDAMMRLAG